MGYKCGSCTATLADSGVRMHFACCDYMDAFGRCFYHVAFMIYQFMHSLQGLKLTLTKRQMSVKIGQLFGNFFIY